jgi:predicted transcriptional regulator
MQKEDRQHSIRLPSDLSDFVQEMADANRRSFSSIVERALEAQVIPYVRRGVMAAIKMIADNTAVESDTFVPFVDDAGTPDYGRGETVDGMLGKRAPLLLGSFREEEYPIVKRAFGRFGVAPTSLNIAYCCSRLRKLVRRRGKVKTKK